MPNSEANARTVIYLALAAFFTIIQMIIGHKEPVLMFGVIMMIIMTVFVQFQREKH